MTPNPSGPESTDVRVAERCNAPAVYYSPRNGYRACAKHSQAVGLLTLSRIEPGEGTYPCDYPKPVAYTLNYRGKGCGGCNLPFHSIREAVAYAAESHATEYTVRHADGTIAAQGTRPDCRHNFPEPIAESVPTVPCDGCLRPVYRFQNPCLPCVKARARGAVTHRCSCGRKARPSEIHRVGSRTWKSCLRCLATLEQLS